MCLKGHMIAARPDLKSIFEAACQPLGRVLQGVSDLIERRRRDVPDFIQHVQIHFSARILDRTDPDHTLSRAAILTSEPVSKIPLNLTTRSHALRPLRVSHLSKHEVGQEFSGWSKVESPTSLKPVLRVHFQYR
eukprot:2998210-Rhodomonas_salina.1